MDGIAKYFIPAIQSPDIMMITTVTMKGSTRAPLRSNVYFLNLLFIIIDA